MGKRKVINPRIIFVSRFNKYQQITIYLDSSGKLKESPSIIVQKPRTEKPRLLVLRARHNMLSKEELEEPRVQEIQSMVNETQNNMMQMVEQVSRRSVEESAFIFENFVHALENCDSYKFQ